jgi:hypothetical protein
MTLGAVAASRRRTAAAAVLGYDVKDSGDTSSMGAGRIYVSKYTLAAPATLTELHAWFGSPGAVNAQSRIVIYAADGGSGNPGTRLAYTNILTWSDDAHVSQAGFSVALAAADYWIGFAGISLGSAGGSQVYAGTGGTHVGVTAGAADPPATPFPTTNTSGTRKHSCWAVIV